MKHTVLPDGHPPTVACTVFAQLCGPKARELEMGAALFTKNGEGRNFDFDYFTNDEQLKQTLVMSHFFSKRNPANQLNRSEKLYTRLSYPISFSMFFNLRLIVLRLGEMKFLLENLPSIFRSIEVVNFFIAMKQLFPFYYLLFSTNF